MRIVGGAWRGRKLIAPPGSATRPTADRVRQALFDMLLHAPWGGSLDGKSVLDAFAGTGALGLEALSRGAASAVFFEQDRAALAALRTNIATCKADARCQVIAHDVLKPPMGAACELIFLDPPYGKGLLTRSLAALRAAHRIGPGAIVIAEVARDEEIDLPGELLAERAHGAARIVFHQMNEADG